MQINTLQNRDRRVNESRPGRTRSSNFWVNAMTIVDLVETSKGQAVPLPEEFRFETSTVSIRHEGAAVIVEAIKPTDWPEHFFDDIRIDDPAFARPNQGVTPPVPLLD
jgi:virulence-associated protein VagC